MPALHKTRFGLEFTSEVATKTPSSSHFSPIKRGYHQVKTILSCQYQNQLISRTMSAIPSQSTIQPTSYVGFDTITTQIEHRLLKKGFHFNVLVAGYSGLGKSTLINTLFSSHLVDSQGRKSSSEPISKTSEINVTSHQLVENNVRLNVNVIDTPGFGDQINNDKCWEPIIRYIKEQYSLYLRKELTAQRERYNPDSRVHAVLYFIQPNNIGLRSVDIAALRKLTECSNVIPVIAKADTLTLEERETFRQTLQKEFQYHDLKLYPYDSEDLLDEEKELNNSIRSIIPFAVIGSETDITIDGQVFKGRRTRWGTINVEDVEQSEFVYLRDFLTRTHLQDLIDSTAFVHYENFRSKQLTSLKENAGTGARTSAHLSQTAPISNAPSNGSAYKQRP